MGDQYRTSRACAERLHVWVKVHCVYVLEHADFLRGLAVIVEEEVQDALREQQRKLFEYFQNPGQQ